MSFCPNCGSGDHSYPDPRTSGPELPVRCDSCGAERWEPNPQSEHYQEAERAAEEDRYRRYW